MPKRCSFGVESYPQTKRGRFVTAKSPRPGPFHIQTPKPYSFVSSLSFSLSLSLSLKCRRDLSFKHHRKYSTTMSRLANTLLPLASSKFRSASTHTFNAFLSILFRFPYLSDNFFFLLLVFLRQICQREL